MKGGRKGRGREREGERKRQRQRREGREAENQGVGAGDIAWGKRRGGGVAGQYRDHFLCLISHHQGSADGVSKTTQEYFKHLRHAIKGRPMEYRP